MEMSLENWKLPVIHDLTDCLNEFVYMNLNVSVELHKSDGY